MNDHLSGSLEKSLQADYVYFATGKPQSRRWRVGAHVEIFQALEIEVLSMQKYGRAMERNLGS